MLHRLPALILAPALLLAACGGAAPAASDGAGTAVPAATAEPAANAAATDTPATDEPVTEATDEPVTEPTDEPAEETPTPQEPTAVPAETPAEESASPAEGESPSAGTTAGGAAACSGSDQNREFFDQAARAVDWPVLCGVLPKGWFVASGSYRLANGGKLLISYKGPGGATIALSEGGFCTAGDGCVPAGTDIGAAALGPLEGTLVGLDDGRFAIVADRGANPSWLLVASGMDQAKTTQLGAALAEVGG